MMNDDNWKASFNIKTFDFGEEIAMETDLIFQDYTQKFYNILNKKQWSAAFNAFNKPLKLEEIKEGMWLWDNMCEEYIQAIDNEWHEYYEEDRFYRYQPLEEE